MLPVQFCNYNLDYQQRLGFLTIVALACDTCRGSRDAYTDRLVQVYEGRRAVSGSIGAIDVRSLLFHPEVPSWQVGFSSERLDRLVLWAEMTGIIARNGRLSEWARILQQIVEAQPRDPEFNPFILTPEQKAFFLQLLLIHDQVLPFLLAGLNTVSAKEPVSVKTACLLTIEALGAFYDSIPSSGPDRIRLRQELRDLLERVAAQYKMRDKKLFLTPDSRARTLAELRDARTVPRAHLAEYHAICRFEQLTDLGLVSKSTEDEKAQSAKKRVWEWSRHPRLHRADSLLVIARTDLERFLTEHWIEFLDVVWGGVRVQLDAVVDQVEVATYLDATILRSRRPLGPIQVHSWALLACLTALRDGKRLEIGSVFRLLDLIRTSAATASIVRQGGRTTFLGRTASVRSTGIADKLMTTPVCDGGGDGN